MNIQKASYANILHLGKEEDFYEKLKLENKTISDLLQSAEEGKRLLVASIIGRKFLIAKILLESGVDAKWVAEDGFNAFHLIAAHLYDENAVAVAEILLEKGAGLDCQDKKCGNTAVFTLCMESLKNRSLPSAREFVCRCLSENKGLDIPNMRGISARNLVEQRGTPEMKVALEKII